MTSGLRTTLFAGGATKSRELWSSMEKRRQILEDVLAQWHRLNLDLVLCPTFAFASVPIKAAGKLKREQKKIMPTSYFFLIGNKIVMILKPPVFTL